MIPYKTFFNREAAQELQEILGEHDIPSTIVENFSSVTLTFLNNPDDSNVQLLLKQSDIEKANLLLEQLAEVENGDPDENYYLYDFTEEELYEIVANADEWSKYDYDLANKLLTERGKDIDINSLKQSEQKQLESLVYGKSQSMWLVFGYIFALMGGLLGIAIGWNFWKLRKTLPDGTEVYAYKERDRIHGRIIFILGVAVLATIICLKIWHG